MQPAELAKPVIIVVLAAFFTGDRATEGQPPTVRRLLAGLAILALPIALIMRQPDLGTTLVFGVIGTAIVVMAGARTRHLLALALMLTFATTAVLTSNTLDEYQRDRLNRIPSIPKGPASGFRTTQASPGCISNGGIPGRGSSRDRRPEDGSCPSSRPTSSSVSSEKGASSAGPC